MIQLACVNREYVNNVYIWVIIVHRNSAFPYLDQQTSFSSSFENQNGRVSSSRSNECEAEAVTQNETHYSGICFEKPRSCILPIWLPSKMRSAIRIAADGSRSENNNRISTLPGKNNHKTIFKIARCEKAGRTAAVEKQKLLLKRSERSEMFKFNYSIIFSRCLCLSSGSLVRGGGSPSASDSKLNQIFHEQQ